MTDENEVQEPSKFDELKARAQAVYEASPFAVKEAAKAFSDLLIAIIEDQEKHIEWLGKQHAQ